MTEPGRPVLYDSPEAFQKKAEAYFAMCEAQGKVETVNGLSLWLGMTRETLLRYAEKDGFSDTVKMIRMRLENQWEQRLALPNATGTIFWLKNQGWSDRSEQVLSNPDGSGLFTGVQVNLVRPATD